jgi:hypothetical protein
MQSLHFQKTDGFHLSTIPDCVMYVFKHQTEPVFICLSHFGQKRTYECTTFFNGLDLTTSSDTRSSVVPNSARQVFQIFPDADPVFLLEEHRNAIRFLKKHGRKPMEVPSKSFRRQYFLHVQETANRVRSHFLWPLRLMLWSLGKNWQAAAMPLEDQADLPFPKGMLQPESQASPQNPASPKAKSTSFRVIFRGTVRQGLTVRQVKENLSRQFKLDRLKADTLFAGNPVLIKSNIDEDTARKYQDAFHKAGAVCEIETEPAGPVQSSPSAEIPQSISKEDEAIRRFQIRNLIASDRTVLEKEFKLHETVGWPAYALAISSFIPYVGMATGSISIFYGMSKRKAGGIKIAVIGFVGLLFTVMSLLSSLYIKFQQDSGTIGLVRVRQAENQLNDLVKAIETYKLQNGAYPESLEALKEANHSVSILDPTDASPESGESREFAYRLDRSGETYFLYSIGPDGIAGTADDIRPTLSQEEMDATGWRARE